MASEVFKRKRLGAEIGWVVLAIHMFQLDVPFSYTVFHSFEGQTQVLGAPRQFTTIDLFDDHLTVRVSLDGLLVEIRHVEEELAIRLVVAGHIIEGVELGHASRIRHLALFARGSIDAVSEDSDNGARGRFA